MDILSTLYLTIFLKLIAAAAIVAIMKRPADVLLSVPLAALVTLPIVLALPYTFPMPSFTAGIVLGLIVIVEACVIAVTQHKRLTPIEAIKVAAVMNIVSFVGLIVVS